MRLVPVLLICALTPVVAGCGAEKSVKNAVDPVAQAATRTASAGSVQLALTGTISAAGQEIPINGKGVFDLKGKRGHFNLTTSAPGKGEVRIEELIDGLVLYMRTDALGSLPGGKHWLKLDLEELGNKAGVDFAQLQQLSNTDPTQFLSYLKKAGNVKKVGTEDINGTATTHYRATIDLEKLAGAGGATGNAVRQLEQATGVKTIPTEIWIDDQGRVRRQTLNYDTQRPVATQVRFTIDYERFGVPVDVQAPDKGDTVDLATLSGG
jgi:hypothetical protein